KFAFTFQHTHYTWICLPQGFHNSHSIFHFHMKVTLSSFSQPKLLLQYADDLLLATEIQEEHLKLLGELLKLLSAAGLKVNPRTAQLLKQQPNQHKVEVICQLLLPNSDAILRSFLGLVSYSREFIPDFAQLAKPLYDLLKKGAEWKWMEPHTEAMSTLKQRLMTVPALMNPDLTAPFHLEVIATEVALAAVLAQECPIAYASRVLTPVECEKNLLATFWTVKHFTYIVGLNPIILHTSHMPTDFLLSQLIKEGGVSNARLTHWSLLLQDTTTPTQSGGMVSGVRREDHNMDIGALQSTDSDIREVIKCLKQGTPLPEGSPYRNYKNNLCLTSDGSVLLYTGWPQTVWVVPQHLRQEMIYSLYDTPIGGHQGQEKTSRMQTVGWWPSIGKDIQDYCNNCLDNPSPCKRNAPLRSQWAEGPWTRIQIDFIGPLPPTARGNKFLLVVTDLFSKWVETFLVKNCTAQATAKALVEQLFTKWGLPLSIDSDQGTHFTGKVLQDALQLLGVTQKFHISYHPQSSGQVERLNRQIKTMLWKLLAVNGENWDQLLPLLLMCIRAMPSSASKVTPYEVMTGRQMRLPEHLWRDLGTLFTDREELNKYVHSLQQNIQQLHKSVAQQLGCSQKKAKRYFNQSAQQVQWNIGDKVMVLVFGTPEHTLC
uniref:Gypsy retrotransposon integrase-like protein 1 n=1 Tax=Latimeria chalumnae TaxID=7897 RepID=H3AKR0_LATCH